MWLYFVKNLNVTFDYLKSILMKTIKKLLFINFTLLIVACKTTPSLGDYTLKGAVFGTTYTIKYVQAEQNYQKSIDSLFFLINKSLSTYISSSDISKINSGDSTVIVDDFFVEVFQKSKKIYQETDGYFDPTVGNLVNAWGFGPKNEKKNLTASEIKEQMRFVGFDKVGLIGNKVVKQHEGIYLDFNAVAKGFGIDVIARFLESKNIENYLVEIGGEIRTKGKKKDNTNWTIKLVNPLYKNELDKFKKLNLSNKSMATSGNYRKYRVSENGTKYVHTINPKTGLATESNLLSASVIASLDCADVDAYATAFMAMGIDKTIEFVEKHKNLDVILLFSDQEGVLKEYVTNNN